MKINVTIKHNIIYSKEKGYIFQLKMINHHQPQLQEYKEGYTLQLYLRSESQSLQVQVHLQDKKNTDCLKCII